MSDEPGYQAKRGKPQPISPGASGQPGAPGPGTPPLCRLTASMCYRLITRRRKWWAWGLALLVSCPTLAVCSSYAEDVFRRLPGSLQDAAIIGVEVVPIFVTSPLAALFSATLAALFLWNDRRSGLLATLALSPADYPPVLRAYHWRGLVPVAFLAVVLLGPSFYLGKAPFHLTFVGYFMGPFFELSGWTVSGIAPGFLADLGTIYLVTALTLAAFVWTRNPVAASVLAFVSWGLLTSAAHVGSTLLISKFGLSDCLWHWPDRFGGRAIEPGYSMFLWASGAGWLALALLAAELALRSAAGRLDRLLGTVRAQIPGNR